MLNSSTLAAQREYVDTVVTHIVTHQRSVGVIERKRLQSSKRNTGTNNYYKHLNSGKLKQNRVERIDQLNASRAFDIKLMEEED